MIYGQWGGELRVLRYATKDDVKQLDPPLDEEARINLANKSWVIVDGEATGLRIVGLWSLRADDGLKEIAACLGDTWVCPDCDKTWPIDERCHNAKCRNRQDARVRAWREKATA